MAMSINISDKLFYYLYWLGWLILLAIGGYSTLYIVINFGSTGVGLISDFLQIIGSSLSPQEFLGPLLNTLLLLFIICFILAFVQVIVISIIGEEVILAVFYLGPWVVMGVSGYLALEQQTPELFIITGVAFLLFALIVWQRKKIRVSARLLEVGAEILIHNPKMFYPALIAFILKLGVFILSITSITFAITTIVSNSESESIVPLILSLAVIILIGAVSIFVSSVISAFAEATNVAYTQQWYKSSNKPSLGKARDRSSSLRGPVARYAFLMAFIRGLKSSGSGGSRRSTGRGRTFSGRRILNIFGFSSTVSALASAAEYFGSYTLVILVAKKMNSVIDAYKASAKGVFSTFVSLSAGKLGLGIADFIQNLITSTILLAVGALYAYLEFIPRVIGTPDNITELIIFVIVFAVIFQVLGSIPLGSLSKPITVAYQYVLYQTFMDLKEGRKLSNRLDSKTTEILKAAFS